MANERWLLKMHGCRTRPDDIVLSRHDYLRYQQRRGALAGLVQGLLLTKHLAFIGFSLKDENFIALPDEVRQARDNQMGRLATAIVHHTSAGMRKLWADELDLVCFEDGRDVEIFVDCIAAHCTETSGHLMDIRYRSLLSEDEKWLERELRRLVQEAPAGLKGSKAWEEVQGLIEAGRKMSGSVFHKFKTLFGRGTDETILLDVGDVAKRHRAIKHLEQALEFTKELPEPWPQTCTYRLGHLVLRDDDPDLQRAAQLFTRAAETDELGIYPLVYLMAVQCRLGKSAEETYKRATDLLRLGGKPRGGTASIQRAEFNLLELAACFADLRHVRDLDGLGGVQWLNHYKRTDAWAVVSFGSTEPMVPQSKKSALATLNGLKARHPDGLFFTLEERSATLEAAGSQETWPTKQMVEYLALLCVAEADDPQTYRFRGKLEEVASGRVGSRGNLDVLKTELRRLVSKWTGRDTVLTKNKLELPTHGAVSLKHLFRS